MKLAEAGGAAEARRVAAETAKLAETAGLAEADWVAEAGRFSILVKLVSTSSIADTPQRHLHYTTLGRPN